MRTLCVAVFVEFLLDCDIVSPDWPIACVPFSDIFFGGLILNLLGLF